MITESTGLAQVKKAMASTGVENSALQTSAGEPSNVEFVVVPVASEATTIMIPGVSTTISASTDPATSLVSTPSRLAPPLWTLYAPS